MAMKFNIHDMRPWEWWNWESDEAYMLLSVLAAYHDAYTIAKEDIAAAKSRE